MHYNSALRIHKNTYLHSRMHIHTHSLKNNVKLIVKVQTNTKKKEEKNYKKKQNVVRTTHTKKLENATYL